MRRAAGGGAPGKTVRADRQARHHRARIIRRAVGGCTCEGGSRRSAERVRGRKFGGDRDTAGRVQPRANGSPDARRPRRGGDGGRRSTTQASASPSSPFLHGCRGPTTAVVARVRRMPLGTMTAACRAGRPGGRNKGVETVTCCTSSHRERWTWGGHTGSCRQSRGGAIGARDRRGRGASRTTRPRGRKVPVPRHLRHGRRCAVQGGTSRRTRP